ncbi:hypothetical protein C7974DRAFT_467335 [Boeremia exigua]|uniref:uncharacterized protein n=1 Tax=Boeremia exigua TaxID=749465 RepID=UPI001E8E1CBD|nr:uncharacterized protein C7974DRAFT_467335 [Boeremia exigua]KAH6643493.1 hypothetical protein C7974DRAFT_467335 [Boeremia exigua]
MPIKLCYFVRRKPTLSTPEFQKVWREVHGPLVASVQTPLNLVKYTQVLRQNNPLDSLFDESRSKLLCDEPKFDVLDEYVFAGSIKDFMGAYDSAEGKAAWKTLIKNEEEYVDFANSILFFTIEHNQIAATPRADVIASDYNRIHRGVVLFEPAEGYGLAYWQCEHAALLRKWAEVIGYYKYQQNHPRKLDTAGVLERLQRDRGCKPSRFKIFTTFWMSLDVPQDDAMGRATAEIQADELSGFITYGSGMIMVAKEIIFVDAYRV